MKEDLEIAYKWFTHPNGKAQKQLSPAVKQKMDDIRDALSTHSLEKTRQLTYGVHFNSKDNPLEAGEILVWAAVYALYLGVDDHIQLARELFQNAASKYSDDDAHYRAITLWLLGLVYWQFPDYKRDAIRHWEYSLRIFTQLSYSQDSLNPAWYQNIRFHVLEALFHARMFKRFLSLKDVKYYRIPSHKKLLSLKVADVTANKQKSSRKPITHRSFPIYQSVPAGGWGVVEPDEIEHADLDHFIIKNIPHHGIDLLGYGQITVQEKEQYTIVRITGTSMNKQGIQDGDFVLIRRQEDADNGDIVLAERIGIDVEATLKRYYKQVNTIELHPDSDDPNHQVLVVDKRDNLRILGIAIAVFKPIASDEPDSETSKSPQMPPSVDDKNEKVIRVKLDW